MSDQSIEILLDKQGSKQGQRTILENVPTQEKYQKDNIEKNVEQQKRHECPECDKSFGRKPDLNKHMKQKHRIEYLAIKLAEQEE